MAAGADGCVAVAADLLLAGSEIVVGRGQLLRSGLRGGGRMMGSSAWMVSSYRKATSCEIDEEEEAAKGTAG